MTPEQRRTIVKHAMKSAGLSERQACRVTGFARSSQRYQSRKDELALGEPPRTSSIQRPQWGYRRLYHSLRRECLRVNRNRVRRVYREAGVHVHQRLRERVAIERTPKSAATTPMERWTMDFVAVALADGRRFCNLTLVDDAMRECTLTEVKRPLSADQHGRTYRNVLCARLIMTRDRSSYSTQVEIRWDNPTGVHRTHPRPPA